MFYSLFLLGNDKNSKLFRLILSRFRRKTKCFAGTVGTMTVRKDRQPNTLCGWIIQRRSSAEDRTSRTADIIDISILVAYQISLMPHLVTESFDQIPVIVSRNFKQCPDIKTVKPLLMGFLRQFRNRSASVRHSDDGKSVHCIQSVNEITRPEPSGNIQFRITQQVDDANIIVPIGVAHSPNRITSQHSRWRSSEFSRISSRVSRIGRMHGHVWKSRVRREPRLRLGDPPPEPIKPLLR